MGESTTITTSLGLFAAVLGNMSIVTYGVAAKHTVAIQCRSGRSPGVFFVFDGSLEPSDRYDGMKLAFGGDVEVLKADRQGDLTHEPLDATAYKKLLVNVEKRRLARDRKPARANNSLRCHRRGPIWDWSMTQKFNRPLSLLYGVCAFGPLTFLILVKVRNQHNLLADLMYLIFYLVVKWYCRKVLDIGREVRYIKVVVDQLAAEDQYRWQLEWNAAKEPPPADGKEAVEDIKFGYTRRLEGQDGTKYLLLPVMSLQPTLSYDAAQWWFIFRRLRGPLLTCSYFFPGSADHRYSVAFAICAFFQACLHDDAARVFLTNTNTYNVNWFRRVEGGVYLEEHGPYHWTLG